MNVAIIGNHIPRQCGIATFTTHLAEGITVALGSDSDVFVVAMNDRPEGYDYPPAVRFQVQAGEPRDYHRAADFINLSVVDLVCLQHEFGIFGGPCGVLVADLLKKLRCPVVTTVHTVLPDPAPVRMEALRTVTAGSDLLVVMSRRAVELLVDCYRIPGRKTRFIHHGTPDLPLADSDSFKAGFGLEGKMLLLNFGLLSERKGIEYMIEAMPAVVRWHPEALFLVLGATHPPVKRKDGEEYRFFLQSRARELGVQENVLFYDRFVSQEELLDFLQACDIYITPYVDRGQIVSGTLAYAVALGKPVVSTKYFYAEELLSGGRGVLVDFRDPGELAAAVLDLLDQPERMLEMSRRCYRYGRSMTWASIAGEYVDLFESVIAGSRHRQVTGLRDSEISVRDLPLPNPDYLSVLSDSTGIMHRSKFDLPRRESGYSAGDNALALAAVVLCHLQAQDSRSLALARVYLGFLQYMQQDNGRFREWLGYDRRFREGPVNDLVQGQALAALGLTLALEPDIGLAALAKQMFEKALGQHRFTGPLAMAYAICGCYHYLTRLDGAGFVLDFMLETGARLLGAYRRGLAPGWRWFEETIRAGNGLLPRALLLCYRATGEELFRKVALESLEFLLEISYENGCFCFVGDRGWFPRGGDKALFNQLPLEAASVAEACVDAYIIEKSTRYLEMSRAALEWFIGRNINRQPLYRFGSGSCADALLSHGVAENRSAQSAACFLIALTRVSAATQPGTAPEAVKAAVSSG